MRGIALLGLILLALLAGCARGESVDADVAHAAIVQTPLDAPAAAEPATPIEAPEATTEAQPEPSATPQTAAAATAEPAPPPAPAEPPMLARQRAACREAGGQLMPRAPGIMACVQPTRDGGRRCDAASDCQGLCLARSGTCAPLAPLFGCQEVFTSPGRRETLCTE